MDSKTLRIARYILGLTMKDMAKLIGKSEKTYSQKENKKGFTDDEKILLTERLDLTFDQFNKIFYDGRLPFEQVWRCADEPR